VGDNPDRDKSDGRGADVSGSPRMRATAAVWRKNVRWLRRGQGLSPNQPCPSLPRGSILEDTLIEDAPNRGGHRGRRNHATVAAVEVAEGTKTQAAEALSNPGQEKPCVQAPQVQSLTPSPNRSRRPFESSVAAKRLAAC